MAEKFDFEKAYKRRELPEGVDPKKPRENPGINLRDGILPYGRFGERRDPLGRIITPGKFYMLVKEVDEGSVIFADEGAVDSKNAHVLQQGVVIVVDPIESLENPTVQPIGRFVEQGNELQFKPFNSF